MTRRITLFAIILVITSIGVGILINVTLHTTTQALPTSYYIPLIILTASSLVISIFQMFYKEIPRRLSPYDRLVETSFKKRVETLLKEVNEYKLSERIRFNAGYQRDYTYGSYKSAGRARSEIDCVLSEIYTDPFKALKILCQELEKDEHRLNNKHYRILVEFLALSKEVFRESEDYLSCDYSIIFSLIFIGIDLFALFIKE